MKNIGLIETKLHYLLFTLAIEMLVVDTCIYKNKLKYKIKCTELRERRSISKYYREIFT